jgi:hypothetical protein
MLTRMPPPRSMSCSADSVRWNSPLWSDIFTAKRGVRTFTTMEMSLDSFPYKPERIHFRYVYKTCYYAPLCKHVKAPPTTT